MDEQRLPASVDEAACRLAELELDRRDDLVDALAALRVAIGDVDCSVDELPALVAAADDLEVALDGDEGARLAAVRGVAIALDALMNRLADEPAAEPAVPRTDAAPGASTADTRDELAGDDEPFVLVPEGAEVEMLGEFVSESRELLDQCEGALLQLEAAPDDADAINMVFRGFHTIKGTAACLGLDGIARFAHRAESLLSRVRDGEFRFSGGVAQLALLSRDAMHSMTEGVARTMDGGTAAPPLGLDALYRALAAPQEFDPADNLTLRDADDGDPQADDGAPRAQSQTRESATDSVRVRTDRLDRLVDMVGELVVAQSMVAEQSAGLASEHQELVRRVHHATKIVRELRDLGLTLRMVPMRGVFRKLARAVRDVTQRNGKQVEFVTEGEATEIDRGMVDLVSDPLVHMVRNAVDHGIEDAEGRRAAGKPECGTVRLSARHVGGSIVLRLEDDGRGLDRERILARGIERGLVEPGAEPSDSEVFALIFEAGFSTAEKITDVSGRGVGLDVVRRGIEQLDGRVEIASTPGRGTTFGIKLPLTLAIADGMQVRCGAQRFIVPTGTVHMSLRPEAPLQTVQGRGELLRLRDELLPVFRLGTLFEIGDAIHDPQRGLLVVLDDGEQRFALLVDELLSQQQVVVKPLNGSIGKVPGVSGAAVLGDGSVGLILEPGELAELGRRLDSRPVA